MACTAVWGRLDPHPQETVQCYWCVGGKWWANECIVFGDQWGEIRGFCQLLTHTIIMLYFWFCHVNICVAIFEIAGTLELGTPTGLEQDTEI